MDKELQALIDKAIAAGHSDEDIRLLVGEHRRRASQPEADQPDATPAPRTSGEARLQELFSGGPDLLSDPLGYGKELLSNILPSTGKVVVDTVTGIPAALKVLGDIQPGVMAYRLLKGEPVAPSVVPMVTGIGQHYKERYWDKNPLDTLRDDPAGAVLDVVPVGKPLQMAGAAGKARLASQVDKLAAAARAPRRMPSGLVVRLKDPKPSATERVLRAGEKVAGAVEGVGKVADFPARAPAAIVRGVGKGLGKAAPRVMARTLSITPEQSKMFQNVDLELGDRYLGPHFGRSVPGSAVMIERALDKGVPSQRKLHQMRADADDALDRMVAGGEQNYALLDDLDINIGEARGRAQTARTAAGSGLQKFLPGGVTSALTSFMGGGLPATIIAGIAGTAATSPTALGLYARGLHKSGKALQKTAITPAIRTALIARLVEMGLSQEMAEAYVDQQEKQPAFRGIVRR